MESGARNFRGYIQSSRGPFRQFSAFVTNQKQLLVQLSLLHSFW
jgi:hypothetical protein